MSDPSLVSYTANAVTLTIDLTDLLQAPILHKRLLIRITCSFQGVSGKTAAYDFRVG
ncbi:MAG: hypothetical protein WAQ33_06620 [Gaiellaceae bacterium]